MLAPCRFRLHLGGGDGEGIAGNAGSHRLPPQPRGRPVEGVRRSLRGDRSFKVVIRILRWLAGAHPDRVAGMQGEVLRHAGDVSGLSLLTSIA